MTRQLDAAARFCSQTRAVSILQRRRGTDAMPLFAERFLMEDDEVVDLGTGESVRLSIERAAAIERARVVVCDHLFAVRHPLLRPLLDYGVIGDYWFEAHANLGALSVPSGMARATALHLVRFLRAAGVEFDAAATARNVRPASEGAGGGWRPIGVSLQPRGVIEAIRTVLEARARPGVTTMAIHGAPGSGLRTLRLQIARLARQAGFLVVDSRFGVLEEACTPARHLCVFDWLTRGETLPTALALAGASSTRGHAWIRFSRDPIASPGIIGLEPLMTRELTEAIYLDADLGPSLAELRTALARGRGLAGPLVEALSVTREGNVSWVHETAPDYVVVPLPRPAERTAASGGVQRLIRAAAAADALAARGRHARAVRVLARCSVGLAARGARDAAVQAALALGKLHLARGRPAKAIAEFGRAREWDTAGAHAARLLIGTGRGRLELGQFIEAESAYRTALAAESAHAADARRGLAEALLMQGRSDLAETVLSESDALLLSAIRRHQGSGVEAARLASQALAAAAPDDFVAICEAHLECLQVYSLTGDAAAVSRHADGARSSARAARLPLLRIRADAESHAALARAGVPVRRARRSRLLAAAARLPPLTAARVRIALDAATAADRALAGVGRDSAHLVDHFHALLHAIHEAPDDEAAIAAIAEDLLRTFDACTVIIRSAALGRVVAQAGRPWPGEARLTQPILEGGGPACSDGLTPGAGHPIVAGGSIVGAIAARWLPAARPPMARVRDLLRTAAAAAAPTLKALAAPSAIVEAGGQVFPDALLGPGAVADRVRDAIRRAALVPFPVLIEGESGSGKELVARAIHIRSSRRARRFCAVNCAALSDDLLEAELFGHARGSFTGAVSERPGLFEEADQGTIFLDEAAELTPRAQAKLLRVLQEGEIRRVGENLPRRVDARVVAATNRPLEPEVAAGRFRADLRFRLDVIRITLPPLRERVDEVPTLARRIWAETCERVGSRATIGEDVLAALARYDWPGNVRELQNVIAALAVHGPRKGRIPASLLPIHIAREAALPVTRFEDARLEFERRYIRAALARAGGRRLLAAHQLGLTRQGLRKMMKRLGIE